MAIPQAGSLVRASDAFLLVPFTPTWTGVTLGSGAVNEGWYQQIGAMVLWGFRLEFGTSPAWTATAQIELPVAAFTGGGASLNATLGAWTLRTGATSNYAGSINSFEAAGTHGTFAGSWQASSAKPDQRIGITSITPLAPVAGNPLSGSGCYRAA